MRGLEMKILMLGCSFCTIVVCGTTELRAMADVARCCLEQYWWEWLALSIIKEFELMNKNTI